LVKIKSGKGFKNANLMYSSARVLPQTKELIVAIGERFLDSVKTRKLSKERVVVNSLTRSLQDQKNLSKGNGNVAQ
jgi:hypothetical protein